MELAKIRSAALRPLNNRISNQKNGRVEVHPAQQIGQNGLYCFPKKSKNLTLDEVQNYILHDVDTFKIVFVDGVYSSFLSETTHEGMDVCLLSAALSQPKFRKVIEQYFDAVADSGDSFTALNTAFGQEGAFVHIPREKRVEKPIQIIHFSTGVNQNLMLQPTTWLWWKPKAKCKSLKDTKLDRYARIDQCGNNLYP